MPLPERDEKVQKEDDLENMLLQLVEVPDQEIQDKYRFDVNLFRRSHLKHATFACKGSGAEMALSGSSPKVEN